MKHKKTISILVVCIAVVAGISALAGMISDSGAGTYTYESIRGEIVNIYGKGLYRHMSAEVAIQGIAQDYVTFFIGIPLLFISLYRTSKGSVRGCYLLAGTLGYFLVTYLFYLVMAMYNYLFLAYAFLLGSAFFAFMLTMLSLGSQRRLIMFNEPAPLKFAGGFLVFNAIAIGFLWLSIVVPPLLAGKVYPRELEHYTTLIVQGMDLGLLLPLSFVCGVLLYKKNRWGYVLGPVYLIFLALLMTALTAKIIGMGMMGYNIIPAIFIIPSLNLIALFISLILLKKIKTGG